MKPYAEYERTSLDRDPNRTYNDGREFQTAVEWTDGQHLIWRCTEKTTAAEVA